MPIQSEPSLGLLPVLHVRSLLSFSWGDYLEGQCRATLLCKENLPGKEANRGKQNEEEEKKRGIESPDPTVPRTRIHLLSLPGSTSQ